MKSIQYFMSYRSETDFRYGPLVGRIVNAGCRFFKGNTPLLCSFSVSSLNEINSIFHELEAETVFRYGPLVGKIVNARCRFSKGNTPLLCSFSVPSLNEINTIFHELEVGNRF